MKKQLTILLFIFLIVGGTVIAEDYGYDTVVDFGYDTDKPVGDGNVTYNYITNNYTLNDTAANQVDHNILNNTQGGTIDNSELYHLNFSVYEFVNGISVWLLNNATLWDEAYSWGDHSLEGYLTSESDPIWTSDKNNYYNKSYVYNKTEIDNFDYINSSQALLENQSVIYVEGGVDLYISPTGDDNLDCTLGNECATPTRLVQEMARYRSDEAITGNIADGTYINPDYIADWITIPSYASGEWVIDGNTANPQNVIFDGNDTTPVTGHSIFVNMNRGLDLTIQGITLQNAFSQITFIGEAEIKDMRFLEYRYAVNMYDGAKVKAYGGGSNDLFFNTSVSNGVSFRIRDQCSLYSTADLEMHGNRYGIYMEKGSIAKLEESVNSKFVAVQDTVVSGSVITLDTGSYIEIRMDLDFDGSSTSGTAISITDSNAILGGSYNHNLQNFTGTGWYLGYNSLVQEPVDSTWDYNSIPHPVRMEHTALLQSTDELDSGGIDYFETTLNRGLDERYLRNGTNASLKNLRTNNIMLYTDQEGNNITIHNDTVFNQNVTILGTLFGGSPITISEGIEFTNSSGSKFNSIYSARFGESWSNVPEEFENTLIFDTNLKNQYAMESCHWDNDNSRMMFCLNEGETSRATTIRRSFQIINNITLKEDDSNFTLCEGYSHIDCNTDATGADLGVADDIEAIGSIYADESLNTDGYLNVSKNIYSGDYFVYNSTEGTLGIGVFNSTFRPFDGTNSLDKGVHILNNNPALILEDVNGARTSLQAGVSGKLLIKDEKTNTELLKIGNDNEWLIESESLTVGNGTAELVLIGDNFIENSTRILFCETSYENNCIDLSYNSDNNQLSYYDWTGGTRNPTPLMSIKRDGGRNVAINWELIVGSSSNPINITMFSPDGNEWSCGVNNGGTFSCN